MKDKRKILITFGTRPEAIKMAPVIKAFKEKENVFDVKVCVTAQHREMLDQVLDIFEITPDYDLDLMTPGQDLFELSSRILLGMKTVLDNEDFDMVFVHGDTTTSSMVSLACFYKKIPVAHVEAGLRTNNIYSPWPEEMNRQLTGRIANYHFAPTGRAKQNLLAENVSDENIFLVGNTVIDSLLWVVNKLDNDIELSSKINNQISELGYTVNKERKIVLITGHRRENFGEGFQSICSAIKELAQQNRGVDFIYPVHLNPNVQTPVNDILSNEENVHLLPPLNYLPFIYLMSNCHLVLTDSGGIQEEAPSLNKPVLVMRDTTERPEAVEVGTARLVGTDKDKIINEVSLLLHNELEYSQMTGKKNPYGDGLTGESIAKILSNKM
jgi:UDP-N-acetylglucosamine 2-epimerase (non-hydrolysing)